MSDIVITIQEMKNTNMKIHEKKKSIMHEYKNEST
jgi:hypothetical protein